MTPPDRPPVAMAPRHPSDALLLVAAELHRFEASEDGALIKAWMDRLDEDTRDAESPFYADIFAEPAWGLATVDLYRRAEVEGLGWPPRPPSDYEALARLMRAAETIDQWHAGVNGGLLDVSQPLELSEDQETARERRRESDCYSRDEDGLLIPGPPGPVLADNLIEHGAEMVLHAHEPCFAGSPRAGRPFLLRRVLKHTVYLPRGEALENPGSRDCFDRELSFVYRQAFEPDTVIRDDEPVRIAVAPIVQAIDDIKVELSDDRTAYGIAPRYPAERLDEAVDQAIEGKACMLLIPEMCIREADLERLKGLIQGRVGDFVRANGRRPRLRYVVCGVTDRNADSPRRHRNAMVVLDGEGVEVVRQDKMFRWDLDREMLDRFGFTAEFGLSHSKLEEDIAPGDVLNIVDLPGIGRLIGLICADAWFNTAGDWAFANVRADWIYQPIMDQSITVEVVERAPEGGVKALAISPWITRRAHRAACIGRARAIATNSIALTLRVNSANDARDLSHWNFKDCGIALLLDGRGTTVRHIHVKAPLDPAATLVDLRDWGGDPHDDEQWGPDWRPFPAEAFKSDPRGP